MTRTLLVLPILAAACAPDAVPESPTWFEHVQPLVAANCARCHGAAPAAPAISRFRLDRYVRGDDASLDAWDYRTAMVDAVEREVTPMPPDSPLSDRQRELLRRWVLDGAPKGPRGNRHPEVEVLEGGGGGTVDQSLALALRAWDEDGDGLRVSVSARAAGASEGEVLVTGLGAGRHALALDTGVLASGKVFEFYATLDDGYFDDPAQNAVEVPLFSAAVDHGALGTAPRATLLSPNGGEALIGATTIEWSASDADPADVLSIALDLIRVESDGSEGVDRPIAQGLPNEPNTFQWDPAGVPTEAGGQPITYRIRVTASDGQNARSDSSDGTFTIATQGVVTEYGWSDVQGIFATYCVGCHGEPARTPALEQFRLDKYDASDPVAPVNADLGVYEKRGEVYQRMVSARTMPPQAEPQPSAAELEVVGNWLLGGAPRGNGTPGGPTFAWQTPNDAAVTRTTSGAVALQWTAADPAGGALSGKIFVAQISAASDALARCDASVTGWSEVAGIAILDGTANWTAPATGYFCFKGEVTAESGASAVHIAAKPVKHSTAPGP